MTTFVKDAEFAADALFFERELLNVLPEIYEEIRPLPSARTLLPLTVSQNPDARVTVATSISWTGRATAGEIGWKNGADTPVISANRAEKYYPVRTYKLAEQWKDMDLRNARRLGLNLDADGVRVIFDDLRLAENDLVWNGDANQIGVYGVTTNPDIGTTAFASADEWDDGATSDMMLADLIQMGNYIAEATAFTRTTPVTIYLPWTAYNIVSAKRMAAGTDTTVLQYFRQNAQPWVADVVPVRELNAAKVAMVMIKDPRIASNHLVRDVYGYEPMRYSAGYSCDYDLRTSGFIVKDSTGIRLFSEILKP